MREGGTALEAKFGVPGVVCKDDPMLGITKPE